MSGGGLIHRTSDSVNPPCRTYNSFSLTFRFLFRSFSSLRSFVVFVVCLHLSLSLSLSHTHVEYFGYPHTAHTFHIFSDLVLLYTSHVFQASSQTTNLINRGRSAVLPCRYFIPAAYSPCCLANKREQTKTFVILLVASANQRYQGHVWMIPRTFLHKKTNACMKY